MIFRCAGYNAGYHASRNAAFQNAVHALTRQAPAHDGDLVDHNGGTGHTELAVRTLGQRLRMSDGDIHDALAQGETLDFEKTPLYAQIHALADKASNTPLPRAMLPPIGLDSPKISRRFTTAMFAEGIERRYRTCLARGSEELTRNSAGALTRTEASVAGCGVRFCRAGCARVRIRAPST